ncbi:MAG TPA: D-lyxose/D-mannose family sugar isomerase [Armatimonadota bacterium]|nr:D-lyxose/D-mannose family sugar isomerase [Armatimonadota bacterium]
MKRSEINTAIETAAEFFARMNFKLPEYAFWPAEKWLDAGPEFDEIRDCMLGWDVTDFGSGDFKHIGRTLFTLRNGRHGNPRYPKVYAEKVIFNPEGQRAPLHFHQSKMEDIINRGGGNILVQVWQAGADNRPSNDSFSLAISGVRRRVGPGDTIRIGPGESICLPPKTFHQFWGEEGTGPSISGEVSSVCDDRTDNYFLERHERFPAIEEDEPPRRLLCSEYPRSGYNGRPDLPQRI